MWQIPTQTRYGCGYVYSDEFWTPEEAKLEVERVLGREIEVRSDIRFQIGRLEKAWIGNCLAVGLISSFLEPLESTSIHGTIVQMMLFADRYLKHPAEMTDADRADYNARVGRQVDDFRTFVNTHYVVERDDTPFWREVRAEPHPSRDQGAARPLADARCRGTSISPITCSACRTSRRSCTTRCSTGSGLLDPELRQGRWRGTQRCAPFARKTSTAWSRNTSRPRPRRSAMPSSWKRVRGNAGEARAAGPPPAHIGNASHGELSAAVATSVAVLGAAVRGFRSRPRSIAKIGVAEIDSDFATLTHVRESPLVALRGMSGAREIPAPRNDLGQDLAVPRALGPRNRGFAASPYFRR